MEDLDNEEMFLDPLPEYLRCPVCLCCLNNPYQTPCGHRFCKDCILPVVHSRSAVCPVDRTPVSITNTFPDNAAKLQINSLSIRCLHPGCEWQGALSDRAAHLLKCTYALISCELCHTEVRKVELETHMAACPQRKVKCEYCGVEVPFSDLSAHHSECPDFPTDCQYHCGVEPIPRKALPMHYTECLALPLACTMAPFGCQEMVKRGALPVHLAECGPKHVHKMAAMILDLQKQVAELSVRVETQRQTTSVLESTMYPCAGQFTWRIDNIHGKVKAAETGDTEASVIYSPSFYSCESGYKICLCVYPAGDNNQGFLSLYFVLMKGQFDEVLPWPFQKRVLLSLISCTSSLRGNQSLVKDIHPDPRLHYFSRPENAKNVGYGYPKFISLPRLLSDDCEFVENGAIFIRARVFQ